LQLPEGYQLDHGDAPAVVNLPPSVTYSVKMSITKTNKLLYERRLTLGSNSVPVFEAKYYPTLKKIFDQIHEGDNHMLTLKSEAPVSAENR
jgi:hypothetical protein